MNGEPHSANREHDFEYEREEARKKTCAPGNGRNYTEKLMFALR